MNDFFLALNDLEKTNSWNDDHAYDFIHRGISKLMSRDVQLLFQLLYRIDVKESLVKEIFQDSTQQDDLIHKLTLLVIARLKQKAEIRRNYSSQ
ncbi:MAG: hypothetical protein JWO58_1444 [Chitinophagaceae bacterium]|nr:hypothetical protein [Chitinophagaceae bacterium]